MVVTDATPIVTPETSKTMEDVTLETYVPRPMTLKEAHWFAREDLDSIVRRTSKMSHEERLTIYLGQAIRMLANAPADPTQKPRLHYHLVGSVYRWMRVMNEIPGTTTNLEKFTAESNAAFETWRRAILADQEYHVNFSVMLQHLITMMYLEDSRRNISSAIRMMKNEMDKSSPPLLYHGGEPDTSIVNHDTITKYPTPGSVLCVVVGRMDAFYRNMGL